MVTNAVHGFVSMVGYIIREHQPVPLAVAFDAPGETFRDEMVADYKAGRAAAPKALPPQFEMIREVMDALAIPVVEAPGFEADDVLATLATEARDRGCDVVVVTGDRDSFQLMEDPHIRVLYNKRGVSDYSLYDEAGIVERCGVPPSKYVLLAALRATPPTTCPASRAWARRRRPSCSPSTATSTESSPTSTSRRPSCGRTWPRTRSWPAPTPRIIPLVRDVPLDVDVDQLQLGGWDRADAAGDVRPLRDEDGLAPHGGAARRRRVGRARPRAVPARRPRVPRR